MPIKIAICDDAVEDIQLLSDALFAYDSSFDITAYTNGETLIDEFMDADLSVDILFLDIYMPRIDGVATAQKIRTRYLDIKIIFLSSSKDHYPQAYEVFAFNYILKPFEREQLYRVLERALDEIGKERGHKIRFSYKSAVYSVDCRNVLYLESRDKLILLHLSDGGILRRYGKLDEIIRELPEQSFLRCHQSFIVNISHITEMGQNYFRVGHILIRISRKYIKSSKDQYYAHLFTCMDGGMTL